MASEITVPFTRDRFDRYRATARAVERREGLLLAVTSVGPGIAPLVFLRWAEAHLDRPPKLSIAGPALPAYLAPLGGLILRMTHRFGAAWPRCPQCGVSLEAVSERVGAGTGRGDRCGGEEVRESAGPSSASAKEGSMKEIARTLRKARVARWAGRVLRFDATGEVEQAMVKPGISLAACLLGRRAAWKGFPPPGGDLWVKVGVNLKKK